MDRKKFAFFTFAVFEKQRIVRLKGMFMER
jgi:hypothetical protein